MPEEITVLGAAQAEARLGDLAEILVDAVEGGASVGFMLPFDRDAALVYWRGILPAVTEGRILLLAAFSDGPAVGTVQLGLATPPNQPHRAEVAKLLVHRSARRRGVARALMGRVEAEARRRGRTLLTLDTLTGGEAERLYLALGYTRVGVIPGYARLPAGSLGDTTIFYKELDPP